MAKVIGLGNALVDIMTPIENDHIIEELGFPKGSMQLVDAGKSNEVVQLTSHIQSTLASGGSAANTIHGIARLGMETAFLGKVGNDHFGEIFVNDLIKSKINPRMFYSNTNTGRAVAMVTPDSERTFATYLGAAVELSPDEITPEIFSGYQLLHIEGYLVFNESLIEKAVKTAKDAGLLISLDLASFNVVEAKKDFLTKIVKSYVDILFANEEEAFAFTGSKDPEEALQFMGSMVDVSVVKVGKNGSFILKNRQKTKVDIIKANPIDTTGAGDYYASGFLFGFLNGLTLKQSGQIGALLAGKVIEVMGAKIPEQTWDLILNEVEKIKDR
jgi:sugar/nucleoside kinase (ribokinase family)